MSAFIEGVVLSDEFRMKKVPEIDTDTVTR